MIYSMSVSVDGYIADREGGFGWSVPDEELFRFHIARTRELGGFRPDLRLGAACRSRSRSGTAC